MNTLTHVASATRDYGRKDGNGTQDEVAIEREIKRVGDDLKRFAEEAQTAIRAAKELSGESKAKVDELLVKHTELAAQMLAVEQKQARPGGASGAERVKSPGHQTIDNERFKEFVSNKTRGSISIEIKAPMLSTGVSQGTPGVIMPEMLPTILPMLRRRLVVRDLISPGTTSAPAVAYVRMTGFVNGATLVAEGTRKPESTITFDTKIEHVATIAHIFKAAKQLLDDMPGLQSVIDDELRWGLSLAEENQILFGTGVGLNLHGIVPQASPFVNAFVPPMQTAIDVIRLAMLQSVLALIPATGVILSPTDWARIELAKTTTGEYIWANPMALGVKTLWGMPVVDTPVMAVNTFLVGAFQGGAQIFDREQSNVVVATQNEDDFVNNLITVRCEERLALVVKRPEAFVTGTFATMI